MSEPPNYTDEMKREDAKFIREIAEILVEVANMNSARRVLFDRHRNRLREIADLIEPPKPPKKYRPWGGKNCPLRIGDTITDTSGIGHRIISLCNYPGLEMRVAFTTDARGSYAEVPICSITGYTFNGLPCGIEETTE